MRNNYYTMVILALTFMSACTPPAKEEQGQQSLRETLESAVANPPAEGFRVQDSDPKAVALADSVMKAMGGREKWDRSRYFSWQFFGRRNLLWDKSTGNVRIESPYDSMTYLLNVHDGQGQAFSGNEAISDTAALDSLLRKGKSIWINDMYWLFMPFKLKDTGVTLSYLGSDSTMEGSPCEVIGITFDQVGDTPENRYKVFIEKSSHLVKQWAYYTKAGDEEPYAVWPWDNYRSYKGLLLSGERSDGKGPSKIVVYDSLPEQAFSDIETKIF